MKRGVDLDGVITNNGWYKGTLWLPSLFICLVLIILSPFISPNIKMLVKLKKWREIGDKIIIISLRPKQTEGLTKKWLDRYTIPYDEIIFLGVGGDPEKRKLRIALELHLGTFIDDSRKTVNFLQRYGINATLP